MSGYLLRSLLHLVALLGRLAARDDLRGVVEQSVLVDEGDKLLIVEAVGAVGVALLKDDAEALRRDARGCLW